MKRCALIWIILCTSLFAVPKGFTSPPEELTLRANTHEVHFTLKQLEAKLKPITVTIDDPVYKQKKSFDGFVLNEVLALAGISLDQATGQNPDEIVFTAKDGYSPNTAFATLRNHRAILAFREHGQSGLGPVAQGKSKVSPAPFYVVWEEGAKLADSVPWAYQLVQIEVVSFKEKYSKLYPSTVPTDSKIMKGFMTFKNQCIRCHSINLQGGDLGPELNIPKNVTEYWSIATLKSFIQDASSFRARDKMPPFKHLKNEEIDQVVEYLEHMKSKKVQP